jgi:hypothetical protein
MTIWGTCHRDADPSETVLKLEALSGGSVFEFGPMVESKSAPRPYKMKNHDLKQPHEGDQTMFALSHTLASDDELAGETFDVELKAKLGLAATERLMCVLYLPDDGTPEQVAVFTAGRLRRPVVVLGDDHEEVLAFARPPVLVMQTEVMFRNPDDVAAATAALTAQGFTVENVDWVDEVDGVVMSPAQCIKVRRWSNTSAMLDLMKSIVGPLGADVSDTSLADDLPFYRSKRN